jgi:hypothetical protein
MLERFYAKQSHGRTAMRVTRYLAESTGFCDPILPKNFQRMGVRHIATYSNALNGGEAISQSFTPLAHPRHY